MADPEKDAVDSLIDDCSQLLSQLGNERDRADTEKARARVLMAIADLLDEWGLAECAEFVRGAENAFGVDDD